MTAAFELKDKIERALTFKDILGRFTEYPQRIYPDPPLLDKKGKPIKDPKAAKAPPPKKKKKGPQFLTPEWATDLSAVRQEYQKMDQLLKQAQELNLSEEFIAEAQTEMKRFKKEIDFRH